MTRPPDGRDTASLTVPPAAAAGCGPPALRVRTSSSEQLIGSLKSLHGRDESSGFVPRRSSKSDGCENRSVHQAKRAIWPAARAKRRNNARRAAAEEPGEPSPRSVGEPDGRTACRSGIDRQRKAALTERPVCSHTSFSA